MAFISADELKTYPVPVTDKQWAMIDNAGAYVAQVLDYATGAIQDYLERDIEEKEYAENVEGTGRPKLMLNDYPILTLDAIKSTDVYGTERTYEPSDFMMDSKAGIIEFLDKYRNTFFKGLIWTIEYTAGYSEIPGPLKHAVALQAVQMLQPLFRGGTNFGQVELITESNEQIVDLCERYKRNRIG